MITAAGRVARRLEAAALRLVIPGVCGLCGGPGQWGRCRAGLDLCVHCEAALPRAAAVEPAGPAEPVLFCPFDYAPPVDFMIRQLKFAGDRGFARTLGVLLAEMRRETGEGLPDLIVPVPLHPDRLRERGYNQAGEIARFAARALGRPLRPRALRRVRATAAQSGLPGAAREANVRGSFAVSPSQKAALSGRRIALVDDVVTTGSTTREAASALLRAGASGVEIWAASQARLAAGDSREAKKKGRRALRPAAPIRPDRAYSVILTPA